MKKIKKCFLPIYLILNILYVYIGSYLFMRRNIRIRQFAEGYRWILFVNVIIIIGLLIYKKVKKEKIGFCKTDLFLLLIIIFSIISVLFAINRNVAINGIPGRYEGIISILYYLSIMFLSSFVDNKYKKIIVIFIIMGGFVQLIYAFLQLFRVKGVVVQYNHSHPIATGFVTNPNFFGTLMLICLCYVIGLYVDGSRFFLEIIYIIFIFSFSIGVAISNTLSVFIGLLFILLFLLYYCIKFKILDKYFIVIIFIIVSILLAQSRGHTNILSDFLKFGGETKEIVKGNIDDNYGTKRLFIWKNTLKIVPENLLTGVGIDNFYYAFGGKPLSKGVYYYDKAHNEYLQILITEGIFALFSYLLFYYSVLKNSVSRCFKNRKTYLILPIIGYFIQAFFNISVVEVAPVFYMALGLSVERDSRDNLIDCNNT